LIEKCGKVYQLNSGIFHGDDCMRKTTLKYAEVQKKQRAKSKSLRTASKATKGRDSDE